jgi:hypothetical protein
VTSGDTLRPGDRVRFEVTSAEPAFIAIVSLDSSGAVTPFLPRAGQTMFVPGGERQLLEGAIALDGAVGRERLYLVACPQARPLADVLAGARAALGRAQAHPERVAALGTGCHEVSFDVQKAVGP